ncbi:unnamed protein product, partial [Symbiodinium necroappetens]
MDPVIQAWRSSEEVMTRLATGSGSILTVTKALNREAVVANSVVLGPLMKTVGMRPTVDQCHEYLARFYSDEGDSASSTDDDGTDSDDSDSSSDDEGAGPGSEPVPPQNVNDAAKVLVEAEGMDAETSRDLKRAIEMSLQSEPEPPMKVLTLPPEALSGAGGSRASSELSPTEIITPSPKHRLLDAFSGDPLYKKRGWHYTVKDRKLGYLCLNCNRSDMDIGKFKLEQCPAGPTLRKTSELDPATIEPPKPAAIPCVTADAEIAAALQLEQQELERLQVLQDLIAEQKQLESLLQQMEAQVAAKKQDLPHVAAPPAVCLDNVDTCPMDIMDMPAKLVSEPLQSVKAEELQESSAATACVVKRDAIT